MIVTDKKIYLKEDIAMKKLLNVLLGVAGVIVLFYMLVLITAWL